MAQKNPNSATELEFPAKFRGGWPPDLSALSGLGFDSVSVSPGAAVIKKAQSTNMAGQPHLFCEITLAKNGVRLKYSVPAGADAELRRLQASVLFFRVASLVPGMEMGAQQLSSLLLPALEASSKLATVDYELLSRQRHDSRREASELSARNLRLAAANEESASAILELEQQASALQARIKKLETVSDAALREMALDWVSSHHGAFNASAFSQANGIPAARAEEGLEMLLQSGALRKIGGAFSIERPESRGTYCLREKGMASSVKEALLRLPLPRGKQA